MKEYFTAQFCAYAQLKGMSALGELRTYLKRQFIFHSSNHLPIWTSNQFRATDIQFQQQNSFVVRIEKIELIKLPPPYDKKCHDYSEKQQFECMNKCIENYYNHQLKCFPNINNHYTIMVDYQIFENNLVFCNDSNDVSKANKFFALSCQSYCGEPCSTTSYNQEIIPTSKNAAFKNEWPEKTIDFIFDNVDYLKIMWLPELTIISLFIKIVNIWSLWHGTHFKLLINLILEYIKKVYSFIFRKIIILIDLKMYFNYEITKVTFLKNLLCKFEHRIHVYIYNLTDVLCRERD